MTQNKARWYSVGTAIVSAAIVFITVGAPAAPTIDTPIERQAPQTFQFENQSPTPRLLLLAFADSRTNKAVGIIQEGTAECGGLRPEYRVDCLRQVYRRARVSLQSAPDYRPATRELRTLERKLDSLVKRNVDRSAPVVRRRGKKIRAVKKAVARTVERAAKKEITEAATRLLRSSGSAANRAHFVKIARAVDSSKRILRS